MQQQAEADITAGASVLLIDPIDTGLRRTALVLPAAVTIDALTHRGRAAVV